MVATISKLSYSPPTISAKVAMAESMIFSLKVTLKRIEKYVKKKTAALPKIVLRDSGQRLLMRGKLR
eukprot:Pgem_evm1s14361